MLVRWLACAAALTSCAHGYRPTVPPAPPADARQRHAAEVAACTSGAWPAWLDDGALNAAIDADRRDAQASVSNEGFHGGTFVAQPPPLAKPGPRAIAIEEERRAFQLACEASKRNVK